MGGGHLREVVAHGGSTVFKKLAQLNNSKKGIKAVSCLYWA